METNKIDRNLRTGIIFIWALLALFFLVSNIYPDFLSDLSHDENEAETLSLVNEGVHLMQKGNYFEAVDKMNLALEKHPNLEEALENLGVIYKNAKRYDDAIHYFNLALKHFPKDSSNIYANLSDSYKLKGDKYNADMYFILSQETNPYKLKKLMDYGVYYLADTSAREPVNKLVEALKERFDIKSYYTDMLKRELRDGKLGSEEKKIITEQLEKGIDMRIYSRELFMTNLLKDKGLAKNYNMAGFKYARIGDYKKAGYYFRKALEIWPQYVEPANNLRYISERASK